MNASEKCNRAEFLGNSLIITQKEKGRETDHWRGTSSSAHGDILVDRLLLLLLLLMTVINRKSSHSNNYKAILYTILCSTCASFVALLTSKPYSLPLRVLSWHITMDSSVCISSPFRRFPCTSVAADGCVLLQNNLHSLPPTITYTLVHKFPVY